MKLFHTVALAATLTTGAWAAEEALTLKTDKDRASYAIGVDIGKSFKTQGLEINEPALLQGIKDSLGGKKLLCTDEEAQAALTALQKELRAKREGSMKEAAEKNKKEGEAFLVENKKKEGVKTFPSGLQYKILKAGEGKTPKASDTVKTHYKGTLLDGTEFDSSYKRNEPAVFPVNGVIAGWTEALQSMPVGSKWQLYVPSNLAYGEGGAGGVIGPNATLVFEVELISIEPAAQAN
jgi:FKBP-type peptidyl-prolyl cis-trans isomerase FklB